MIDCAKDTVVLLELLYASKQLTNCKGLHTSGEQSAFYNTPGHDKQLDFSRVFERMFHV